MRGREGRDPGQRSHAAPRPGGVSGCCRTPADHPAGRGRAGLGPSSAQRRDEHEGLLVHPPRPGLRCRPLPGQVLPGDLLSASGGHCHGRPPLPDAHGRRGRPPSRGSARRCRVVQRAEAPSTPEPRAAQPHPGRATRPSGSHPRGKARTVEISIEGSVSWTRGHVICHSAVQPSAK